MGMHFYGKPNAGYTTCERITHTIDEYGGRNLNIGPSYLASQKSWMHSLTESFTNQFIGLLDLSSGLINE